MSGAGYPADHGRGDAKRRRVLCWLPLVTGAVVLSLCWIAMAAMLAVNGGTTCFFGETGLDAVGNALAHDIGIWDESGLGAG